MDPNLRNFKDFLTLYNKVTEMCFGRCVDNLNERNLASHEDVCVDRCVTKFARFNQNMMNFYVEVQTSLNAKRMKEEEERAKIAAQQEDQRLKELAATAVLTPVPPTAAGNLSL
ncbi:mitochondrial import inner membrane translocase subunit Tim10B [Drosophila kikkawai]|uniref:Mitochondrial import inner membrane translocase subunit n=1 Tax=Drosophila kikkawai TaxID=30033 RepID=A0A6P4JH95_DROKI|nr:mitochondrial import inner membrane translocase subunit Tim10B [Drosophila kikkawai]